MVVNALVCPFTLLLTLLRLAGLSHDVHDVAYDASMSECVKRCSLHQLIHPLCVMIHTGLLHLSHSRRIVNGDEDGDDDGDIDEDDDDADDDDVDDDDDDGVDDSNGSSGESGADGHGNSPVVADVDFGGLAGSGLDFTAMLGVGMINPGANGVIPAAVAAAAAAAAAEAGAEAEHGASLLPGISFNNHQCGSEPGIGVGSLALAHTAVHTRPIITEVVEEEDENSGVADAANTDAQLEEMLHSIDAKGSDMDIEAAIGLPSGKEDASAIAMTECTVVKDKEKEHEDADEDEDEDDGSWLLRNMEDVLDRRAKSEKFDTSESDVYREMDLAEHKDLAARSYSLREIMNDECVARLHVCAALLPAMKDVSGSSSDSTATTTNDDDNYVDILIDSLKSHFSDENGQLMVFYLSVIVLVNVSAIRLIICFSFDT